MNKESRNTIEAVFIGYNSLGYINGVAYTLIVNNNTVRRLDGKGICRYSSIESFLKNWKQLK